MALCENYISINKVIIKAFMLLLSVNSSNAVIYTNIQSLSTARQNSTK